MKKKLLHIIVFVILCTTNTVLSQDFSLMGGVNFTKRRYHHTVLPNTDNDPNFLYVTGYNLGGFIEWEIAKFFCLRPGLMIQSQGYQYDNYFYYYATGSSQPVVNTIRQKFQYQYFTIPVDIKLMMKVNRKFDAYLSSGVYTGYSLFGRSTQIDKLTFSSEGLASDMTTGPINMRKSTFPRLDYGLRFGFGFYFKRVIVEFNSIVGLRSYWKESATDYSNEFGDKLKTPYRGITLSVGYRFGEVFRI